MSPPPRTEPGLEAFGYWLDRQMHRTADARGGILGAIIGTSWGISGGLAGILGGAFQLPMGVAFSSMLVGVAGTAYGLVWYYRGKTQDDQELVRLHGETRGLVWKLQHQRWRNTLSIPEPARSILEEGAKAWRQAINAFESPSWVASGSDSAHATARDRGRNAIEAAMAQLALLLASGGFSDSVEQSARGLVAEMVQIADEAQSLAGQIGERGTPVGDVSSNLRSALQDLRSLTEAETELRNTVRDGDSSG